jgi:hypothetical protein
MGGVGVNFDVYEGEICIYTCVYIHVCMNECIYSFMHMYTYISIFFIVIHKYI